MSFLKWVLVITALAALGYNLWSASGRNYGKHNYTPYPIDQIITEGFDAGKGNIIGFQPYFTAWDYCDQQHFVKLSIPTSKKPVRQGFAGPTPLLCFLNIPVPGWLLQTRKPRFTRQTQ